MSERVFLVEHRVRTLSGGDDGIIAHVASSLCKAVRFVRRNKNYDTRDPKEMPIPWFWCISMETLDDYGLATKCWFFDWDGQRLNEFPTGR